MAAGKIETRIAVPYRRTQGFGDRDHIVPAIRRSGGEIRDDDRALGGSQRIGCVCECHGIGRRRGRHADGTRRRQLHLVIELRLLKSCVVAHIDRPLTAAHHDRVCAGEGVRRAVDGGRLIVPFHDMAYRLTLNIGGMDPIDEGAPLGFGQGAGRADDEHRRAIEISVIDAHRRVEQSDHVVDDGDHRLAARPRIAVRYLHGNFFVVAEQYRRIVFAVIDQRIVQAAVTRSRIERDIRKAVTFDQIDDDVGLPMAIGFADSVRAFCRHPGSPMLGGDRVPIIVAVAERTETAPGSTGGGR